MVRREYVAHEAQMANGYSARRLGVRSAMCQRLSCVTREECARNGLLPRKLIFPRFILVELTHQCNLRCIHCYNNSGSAGGDLGDNVWIRLCQEACEAGVFYFTLSGGEPLLRRDLCFKLMEMLNKHHVRITIISNGWLLDAEVVARLKPCDWILVVLSIDGSRAAVHDAARGIDGSWQRAIDAALRVTAAGLPLRIVYNIFPSNYQYVDEMVELALSVRAVSLHFGIPTLTGRAAQHPARVLIPEETYAAVCARISDWAIKFKQRLEILAPQPSPSAYLNCAVGQLNDAMLIRPNGDVRLDCIVPYTFGNVSRQSLRQVWNDGLNTGWCDSRVARFVRSIRGPLDLITNMPKGNGLDA